MLNNIARAVRFEELCESEKTNEKVWLAPVLALGDTESAEGVAGGMTTVQAPFARNPVLVTASAAYK